MDRFGASVRLLLALARTIRINSRPEDRGKTIQEIESLFEQAADQYPGAKLPDGDAVAERAKSELFTLRNLSVGRPAPEIEGEDQDGKRFKLQRLEKTIKAAE